MQHMKKENAALVASLLLNAGLTAVLAMPSATTPAPGKPQLPAVTSPEAQQASADAAAARVSPPAKPISTNAATAAPMTVERARSGHSVRELVAELRRRGVDEGTVRRLGVAHAERLFRVEARALLSSREKLEYWQAPTDLRWFGQIEPAKLREFQRLRRERVEVLDELFGDVEAEATEQNTVNHYLSDSSEFRFEYAPLEKRLALTEFFERETTGMGQTPVQRLLSERMPGPRRELEWEGKIREILGPELFDEYLLQSSGISSRLKYELAAMQPTHAEFDQLVRAEYDLLRQQSETFATLRLPGPYGGAEPASLKKLEEARKEVVRDVLGEARYADYERSTDPAFRHLDLLARELGLGTSAARAAFAHVERARNQVLALAPEIARMDSKAIDELRKIRNETAGRVADDLGLQALSDSEQHTVLGPALHIHPQQVAQRMYRWY